MVQLRLDPTADAGLLGLWTERPESPDVAFSGSSDVADVDDAVWQVHLPSDGPSAWQTLQASERALEVSQRRLDQLPALVDEWLIDGRPEEPADVSFGTEPDGGDLDAEPAVEGLRRLIRVGAPTAWVETHVAHRLIARSRTTFAGDLDTVVFRGEADALARHERSLALAGASRITALQTTAATVRAAVAIATRLSLPGGPLLALPLAWRLLRRAAGPGGTGGTGG